MHWASLMRLSLGEAFSSSEKCNGTFSLPLLGLAVGTLCQTDSDFASTSSLSISTLSVAPHSCSIPLKASS